LGASSLVQPRAEFVRRSNALVLLGYQLTSSEVTDCYSQSRERAVVGGLAHTHPDFVGAMRALSGVSSTPAGWSRALLG
jgi:hypothetical protein